MKIEQVNAPAAAAKRYSVIGNYSCANRGDASIYRGLLAELQRIGAEPLRCYSDQPDSAEYLLDRPLRATPLRRMRPTRLRTAALRLAAAFPAIGCPLLRQHAAMRRAIDQIRESSGLIFVGGSYFVDVYGSRKCYLPLVAQACRIPYVLCGHSVGPFERSAFLARQALGGAELVVLRDPSSMSHVRQLRLPEEKVIVAADTAWLIPQPEPNDYRSVDTLLSAGGLDPAGTESPMLAVTARDLAPFDRRMGLSQDRFEAALARCLDEAIEQGMGVVGISMCTGLGGYHMDDRLVLLRVRAQLRHPQRMAVLMEELCDMQLAAVFARCAVLLGARMHSTILSMNVGTPALGIAYEHKFAGLFEAMGFNDRLLDPRELEPRRVVQCLQKLSGSEEAREATARAAAEQRSRAAAGVNACVKALLGRANLTTAHATRAAAGLAIGAAPGVVPSQS